MMGKSRWSTPKSRKAVLSSLKIHGQGHPKDTGQRIFWNDNGMLADAFNEWVFKKEIIKPEYLYETTDAEKAMLRFNNGTMGLALFRDLAKRWEVPGEDDRIVYLALLAYEGQNYINYQMPFRTFAMDNVNYARQVTEIENNRGKDFWDRAKELIGRSMTEGEYLGRFLKTDRICPVITLVVYNGDDPWDGPMCLKDMFVDSPVKDYVNDYPMHLLDIKHISQAELDMFSEPLRTCLGMMRLSGSKQIKGYVEDNANILDNLPRHLWDSLLDMIDAKGYFLPVDDGEEEGGNKVCKGLELWAEEQRMITAMWTGKKLGASKDDLVSVLGNGFNDLDEKAAKELVEKYWDSEEVNR